MASALSRARAPLLAMSKSEGRGWASRHQKWIQVVSARCSSCIESAALHLQRTIQPTHNINLTLANMVHLSSWLSAIAIASTIPAALGHPGEAHDAIKHKREMAAMEAHSAKIQRGLDNCQAHPSYKALKARGAARRSERARVLRQKRGVPINSKSASVAFSSARRCSPKSTAQVRRADVDYSTLYSTTSHNFTSSGYNLASPASTLFQSYKNVSCSLTPETTEGPYYITGENYRSNVVETQAGVPLHLEIQYIDINTCDAAPGIFIEAWHANATGVYSGVSTNGNGVGTADPGNLNKTFLRGVQATDAEGVAAFDSIFPGHYTGRATHIHLLSHANGTIQQNGTFTSATVQSVGQIGFDQTLISAVEETAPYNTNTQSLTTNGDDTILVGAADAGNDPYVEYAYLGDDLEDGLLAWVHVGYNSSDSISVSPGAYFYGTGGVESTNSGMGGGGSGGPSGAPSGAFPSGAAPSGIPSSASVASSAAATSAAASSVSRAASSAATSLAPSASAASSIAATSASAAASISRAASSAAAYPAPSTASAAASAASSSASHAQSSVAAAVSEAASSASSARSSAAAAVSEAAASVSRARSSAAAAVSEAAASASRARSSAAAQPPITCGA